MSLPDLIHRIQLVTLNRCPDRKKVRTRAGITTEPIPWKVLDSRETEHGYDIALIVPNGYSTQDLRQETDSIYATCGAPITIKDRGGVSLVSISKKEFPSLIPYNPLSHLCQFTGRKVLLGYDVLGRPITHDFRVPHLLIGAMSGYGKTDLLRFILLQLISQLTSDQLWIDIIDGKGFSFLPFRNIPHIRRIVRDLPSASRIMQEARTVMESRSDEIWTMNDRTLVSSFQWRLVIVDELAAISPEIVVGKEAKKIAAATYADMAAVSCIGREASVGLIMATQRPDRNVIHPQVKANCDVSIAMRVKNQVNSEIILDRPGAEKLSVPGRAIYSSTEDTTFHIPYVGKDDAWENVLSPYYKEKTHEDERIQVNEDLSTFILDPGYLNE